MYCHTVCAVGLMCCRAPNLDKEDLGSFRAYFLTVVEVCIASSRIGEYDTQQNMNKSVVAVNAVREKIDNMCVRRVLPSQGCDRLKPYRKHPDHSHLGER